MNRDRHEIVMEILKAAKTGKNKNQIMSEAKLSTALTSLYIENLMENGLLEMDAENFLTTPKGIDSLNKCKMCPLLNWTK
jgi:predicted transcriptional regulator